MADSPEPRWPWETEHVLSSSSLRFLPTSLRVAPSTPSACTEGVMGQSSYLHLLQKHQGRAWAGFTLTPSSGRMGVRLTQASPSLAPFLRKRAGWLYHRSNGRYLGALVLTRVAFLGHVATSRPEHCWSPPCPRVSHGSGLRGLQQTGSPPPRAMPGAGRAPVRACWAHAAALTEVAEPAFMCTG